jgi:hypothetical protein
MLKKKKTLYFPIPMLRVVLVLLAASRFMNKQHKVTNPFQFHRSRLSSSRHLFALFPFDSEPTVPNLSL